MANGTEPFDLRYYVKYKGKRVVEILDKDGNPETHEVGPAFPRRYKKFLLACISHYREQVFVDTAGAMGNEVTKKGKK